MQVDVVEKDGTIQKLRELVEQRDTRLTAKTLEVENMQRRIEELSDTLKLQERMQR